ncbi:MAG: 2-dehydropantoate 2-reductase [Candidatus Omnitrophota bacterium]|nr:2-dehydropantoate 2-reductase [Candidatus Omnitrophota bacterium]
MIISIIGAGAIGSVVAAYLTKKGQQALLVCHPEQLDAIKEKGLNVNGVRGSFHINVEAVPILDREVDLIIFAVKTQDIVKAAIENQRYLKGKPVLTTQNGVQADTLLSKIVDKNNIISSIVMFGATYLEIGNVVHNFEGSWILGRAFGPNDELVHKIGGILNEIFPVVKTEEIMPMKYLKIFVNANNCIPAILGLGMQESFVDLEISRIGISIWKEGLNIVNKSNIKLTSLPDFPLERLIKLTAMPSMEAAKIFSGIMVNLSKEPLFGSILQSIKRGRNSEIDYINGEFVNIAKKNSLSALLNERLVNMVHEVERTKSFFSKDKLMTATKDLIST